MKKLILLSIISSIAMADCSYKINKLERELSYAKQYGNFNRVRGLENALANVRAHCGGGSVYNNDYYARKNEIKDTIERLEDEAERKIDRIEDKLDELNDMKNSMSKDEYKRRKAELKAEKSRIKDEYKRQKQALKNSYKY